MRNESVILATILTLLSVNANAARNTRGARVVVPRAQTQNVNVTGTTTSISATIADTIADKTPYATTSGKVNIAPITDKQAEKICTTMVVNSLKAHCDTGNGKNKCKNPTEIYATMEYIATKNDKDETIADETYCANFLETAVNKLWNSYDSVATLNEENCNIALAKSFAAEDCYLYVMTNQTEKIIINEDDLKSRCGKKGIAKQYNALTGEDKSELGDDKLAEYFSKVGNIGLSDLMAYPARVMDGKIDFKSSSFPRELVQLVNTIKSQGNVMCGPDRYTELYDTNMPLEIKQTSLQKAIQDKGIAKGTFDWGLDQAGIVLGEDKIDSIRDNGMMGKKKDTKVKTTTPAETKMLDLPEPKQIQEPNPDDPIEPEMIEVPEVKID